MPTTGDDLSPMPPISVPLRPRTVSTTTISWLGIDFADLYAATRQRRFLDEAERIWLFVASGTDDRLGGGIYWCEQKKGSKNTCSNAPGAVLALKLYLATGREEYLEQGRALYEWTRKRLLDRSDDLYFDNISLKGAVNKAKFSYNSGQMIQAGALLHRITGKKRYLAEAQQTAAACLTHFFRPVHKPGGGSVPDFCGADKIWFDAVMLRGFIELSREDGRQTGLDAFRQTLDHAWTCSRDCRGLLADWSGPRPRGAQVASVAGCAGRDVRPDGGCRRITDLSNLRIIPKR